MDDFCLPNDSDLYNYISRNPNCCMSDILKDYGSRPHVTRSGVEMHRAIDLLVLKEALIRLVSNQLIVESKSLDGKTKNGRSIFRANQITG